MKRIITGVGICRSVLAYLIVWTLGCTGQNQISTNKIITTQDHRFGVLSQNGNLLIDSIYGDIRVFTEQARLTLPPVRHRPDPKTLPYYVVTHTNGEKAIFDQDGEVIFDFVPCLDIQIDLVTRSIVTRIMLPDNRQRSYLYNWEGQLVFDQAFENIAFINGSKLIALIAEDGPNEEYYLYHATRGEKLGPFTHFNIFNADTSFPMGMDEPAFEQYKSLNAITVRQTQGNEYVWGVIDLDGKEILPIAYNYFRVIDASNRKRFIDKAKKPADTNLLFSSSHIDRPSSGLFIDQHWQVYEYIRTPGSDAEIRKLE